AESGVAKLFAIVVVSSEGDPDTSAKLLEPDELESGAGVSSSVSSDDEELVGASVAEDEDEPEEFLSKSFTMSRYEEPSSSGESVDVPSDEES
ncbi:hypothetical protein BBO99_00009694, partial [Phytophthora kernoviae]